MIKEKAWRSIMGNRFAPLTSDEIISLIAVSKREKAATVWIKDGRVANLFTGEITNVHIAIDGKRIAYVGAKEPKIDEHTQIIDASDYIVMPGYIEPHAHPFQMYHPFSLADYCIERGTTTIIADNMSFYNRLDLKQWFGMMDDLSTHTAKFLWWARLEPQSSQAELLERYRPESIAQLLAHPAVIQGGELSHWLELLAGDPAMVSKMAAAKKVGKRIEGHAPGASEDTLNALVAAGVTSDHEAIVAEEVLRRLRLGLYTPLRHSSIRPDLPVLLDGLKGLQHGWDRLLLTTDGSTPPFLAQGFTDALIAIAIDHGIDPILAYRMATVNVATYYGLDEYIGLIAPSRFADLVFLEAIDKPTPKQVMVEGKVVYQQTTPYEPFSDRASIDWDKYDLQYKPATPTLPIGANDFRIPWEENQPFPIIHLINDVITVQADRVLDVKEGYLVPQKEGQLHIALVDRNGRWITRGILSGFGERIPALATTYTISMDYLVIGNDRLAMEKALQYVHQHSGFVLIGEDEEIHHLPLPIGGGLSSLPMAALIQQSKQFLQQLKNRGFTHSDPYYCMLFLTSTHLPKLRITEAGVFSIKDQQIVIPSTPVQ